MHHQLEILLELQDLKAQKRDLEEAAEEHSHDIERKVFRVKPKDAVAQLSDKIEEMEGTLEPEVEKRYHKIAGRRPRPVVPVLNGICYGCFMAVPTATDKTNAEIRWCEQCGSFIYFVD
jgi:predicted  nucleic acid-binding Zn-ribbon protein